LHNCLVSPPTKQSPLDASPTRLHGPIPIRHWLSPTTSSERHRRTTTYNTNGPYPRPAKIIPLPPDDDDDESFEAGALSRAITMQSTASTLVAQDGSNMSEARNSRSLLKPFRLMARGTPASSITTPTQLSRYPSTRHLLREESQWFESDIPEEPEEDRIDEVMRYPMRRNEPSQDRGGHWQSDIIP